MCILGGIMKKALVLLLVVSATQGLFSGNYDLLNKYFEDSKITKRCLEKSQDKAVASQCDFLNRELQEYEDIVRLAGKVVTQRYPFSLIPYVQMRHKMDYLASERRIFNAIDIILSDESNETKTKEFDLLRSMFYLKV